MENQDLKEHQIKVEETIPSDEQQPPEGIVVEITQNISPASQVTAKTSLATTVITTQRHRMITTAGHIRYTKHNSLLIFLC